MIQPMGARVLVKRLEAPKPQSALIHIPESIQDRPSQFALVLAVGKLRHGGVSVGDMVVLSPYSGAPVTIPFDGEQIEAVIVPEDDVLMVVSGM